MKGKTLDGREMLSSVPLEVYRGWWQRSGPEDERFHQVGEAKQCSSALPETGCPQGTSSFVPKAHLYILCLHLRKHFCIEAMF